MAFNVGHIYTVYFCKPLIIAEIRGIVTVGILEYWNSGVMGE
jgi:hypothetical protein